MIFNEQVSEHNAIAVCFVSINVKETANQAGIILTS